MRPTTAPKVPQTPKQKKSVKLQVDVPKSLWQEARAEGVRRGMAAAAVIEIALTNWLAIKK